MPHNLRLPLNRAQPNVLHIDLNSCFASVEQQARPLLRKRPVGVTNRLAEHCILIAVSYEAKALGVKVGMRNSDAKLLAPGIVVLESDPPKYHFVYQQLVRIMRSYSPNIVMKSIDEGIIDFAGTRAAVNRRPLVEIGYEIKRRLKADVGDWMRCNIGIAPNRFLAKTAASLHRPDGLDVITYKNLRRTLAGLELTDLHGIAERNTAWLNAAGIYTPLQFLDAPSELLHRRVFRSVCGEDWYQRLRGYEVDDRDFGVKTVGRQFVMDEARPSVEKVRSRLAILCETTGLKLRYKGLCARGVMVYARYSTGDYWYERKAFKTSFFSNAEIHRRATLLFNRAPADGWVRELGVSCYLLAPSNSNQISLLEEVNREVWLTEAVDTINAQFGDSTITMAVSAGSKGKVKQKIPFGSTRYFELLCQQS